jgi:AcrR family transcriptional regulator
LREAGVSVPTVYRYFRTKRDLIDALHIYLIEKLSRNISSSPSLHPPRTLEELAVMVRQVFLSVEGLDETARAAIPSALSFEIRKEALPARIKMIEDVLAPVLEGLDERDRVRLRNVVLILSSTAMVRAFKDYLDLSGEEAADNAIWAILTLTEAAKQKSDSQHVQKKGR